MPANIGGKQAIESILEKIGVPKEACSLSQSLFSPYKVSHAVEIQSLPHLTCRFRGLNSDRTR